MQSCTRLTSIGPPDIRHFDRWLDQTNRLGTEGLDHLPTAIRASGVPHIVAQSHGACNGRREGGWVKTEQEGTDALEGTQAESGIVAGGTSLTSWLHLDDAARPMPTSSRCGARYAP